MRAESSKPNSRRMVALRVAPSSSMRQTRLLGLSCDIQSGRVSPGRASSKSGSMAAGARSSTAPGRADAWIPQGIGLEVTGVHIAGEHRGRKSATPSLERPCRWQRLASEPSGAADGKDRGPSEQLPGLPSQTAEPSLWYRQCPATPGLPRPDREAGFAE